MRIAFDPEAIPEHPGAQLASYGTPLVDRLLADAVERGRRVVLYMVGLNLAASGLEDRLRRAVSLPAGIRPARSSRSRPLFFPQAVFWFEATFVSDQKEQEILPVAIDLHHGRQVRHLDRLLDRAPPGRDAFAAPGGGAASGPGVGLSDRAGPRGPDPRGPGQHPAARAGGAAGPAARTHRPLLRRPSSRGRGAGPSGAEPRRGPRPFQGPARGTLPRGAAPHRRAPAEEPVEGPPAAPQPGGDPSAQAARRHTREHRGQGTESRGRPSWSGCGIRLSRTWRPPSVPSATIPRSNSASPAKAGSPAPLAPPPVRPRPAARKGGLVPPGLPTGV